jgi:trans-2-enoyl-CoA reductase
VCSNAHPAGCERQVRRQLDYARRDPADWAGGNTHNLVELSDFAGYQRYFRQLFGFDVPRVDYEAAVETDLPLEPAD